MKKEKHVFWETLLILSSVLVFRSMWLLMDEVPLFYEPPVLGITFVIGLFLGGVAFYRMAHSK